MLPMRVFKGKKLPGHMGTLTVTIQNLEVVKVDLEDNVILIKGNIPGPKRGLVIIKSAVKNPDKINEVEELNSYVVEEEVTEKVENQQQDNKVETQESTEEVTNETTEEEK